MYDNNFYFHEGNAVQQKPAWQLLICLMGLVGANIAWAHAVAAGDQGYIQEITGVHLAAFMYLGAKHMSCLASFSFSTGCATWRCT